MENGLALEKYTDNAVVITIHPLINREEVLRLIAFFKVMGERAESLTEISLK